MNTQSRVTEKWDDAGHGKRRVDEVELHFITVHE